MALGVVYASCAGFLVGLLCGVSAKFLHRGGR